MPSTRRLPESPRQSPLSGWLAGIPIVSLILWGCLWLNLNTGFWNFENVDTPWKLTLAIRAALTFAVLPLSVLIVIKNQRQLSLPRFSPSRLLMIYGVICAVAAAFSPEPGYSLYWAVAFLAAVVAPWTWLCQGDSVLASRRMLQVTWVVTLVAAIALAYTLRGRVFGNATYNVRDFLGQSSRESGIARWAAVPGLVCLLKASHARRPAFLAAYLSLAALAFFVVYRMQSRGALFGSVVALAFGLFGAARLRKHVLPALLLASAILVVTDPDLAFTERVSTYLHRGQSEEQFRSMTGRMRAYQHGIQAFSDAPLLGRGHVADRLVIGEHSHNSFLYALLASGIAGFLPYLGSWIAGWVLFAKLFKIRDALPPPDREPLMEAGAVMLFFTVRAMPETTTASYAPDLLIMAAVYVYLEALANRYMAGAPSGHVQANRVHVGRRLGWSGSRLPSAP